MLSGINRKNIPLILVNGRISNKSFKRWQQFDYISKELLGCFTFCLGQSEEDAYRLRVLGARDSMCLGNLKYAGLQPPIDAAKRDEIAAQIGSRPLWNVSSTHRDEEVKIGKFLKRVQEKVPGLLTIMAPRHPNRGPEIQQDLDNLGLTTALRSKGEPITAQTDVYIADTIGEVGIWYDLGAAGIHRRFADSARRSELYGTFPHARCRHCRPAYVQFYRCHEPCQKGRRRHSGQRRSGA